MRRQISNVIGLLEIFVEIDNSAFVLTRSVIYCGSQKTNLVKLRFIALLKLRNLHGVPVK